MQHPRGLADILRRDVVRKVNERHARCDAKHDALHHTYITVGGAKVREQRDGRRWRWTWSDAYSTSRQAKRTRPARRSVTVRVTSSLTTPPIGVGMSLRPTTRVSACTSGLSRRAITQRTYGCSTPANTAVSPGSFATMVPSMIMRAAPFARFLPCASGNPGHGRMPSSRHFTAGSGAGVKRSHGHMVTRSHGASRAGAPLFVGGQHPGIVGRERGMAAA